MKAIHTILIISISSRKLSTLEVTHVWVSQVTCSIHYIGSAFLHQLNHLNGTLRNLRYILDLSRYSQNQVNDYG